MYVGSLISGRVVAVAPEATVRDAIARMVDSNVGAVAICDQSRLVGIFTERDVLRLAGDAGFQERPVVEVMTRAPVTVAPDVHVVDAARLMRERKIRHLPVVEGENLHGVLGIRDVMGALVERVWQTHDEGAHDTARSLLTPDR